MINETVHTIETNIGLIMVSDNLADLKHAETISKKFSYRNSKVVIWINAKEIVIIKNELDLVVKFSL
jgi:hypothetical protein